MLKSFLLKLSRRWIAGEGRKDALDRARKLNSNGIGAVINYLGEHYNHLSLVEQAEKEYLALVSETRKKKLNASVSVKLSELGMDFSPKLCRKNLKAILEKAREANVFVWVDMESHDYAQKTIEAYFHVLPLFDNVGITIQSSLRRGERDIKTLLQLRQSKIRLAKGAYREKELVAFKTREEIRENFLKLMIMLFVHPNYFAIATHDLKLIEEAKSLAQTFSSEKKNQFEFQLLMGLKNRLKKKLARQGYNVSEYVPYGRHWPAYVKRRLSERKTNILHAIGSVLE